ncbi:MAG: c-type cytochrome [Spirosomataceae bacterium]
MKKFLPILAWLAAGLCLILLGLFSFVQIKSSSSFEAPLPDIQASRDTAVIARGRHLVLGPAHCVSCHVPMNQVKAVEYGAVVPLSGGWEMAIPPGVFRAPNLTPDLETGIGKKSDGELARALRYSVSSTGGCLFPLMPFQELSDEDLTAVISFLRSQEPIRNEVKPSEYSFMGKALVAFGVMKPVGPHQNPPKQVTIDSTVEYGSYLANRVANCNGCHTERDFKTGAFVGVPFSGGTRFLPDPFTEGYSFITPNLTPDQTTGIMAQWDEAAFLRRMRAGKVHKGSPMPWATYARMSDLELKAIYRYLRSLDPVTNPIQQIVFAPGEKLPE